MNLSFQSNVSLRALNTFGIEACAAHFLRLTSVEQLRALREHVLWQQPRLILGGGSNLLLTKDFDGLVMQMALSGRSLVDEDESAWYVRVAAGENWDHFVRWTLGSGWPGLENLVLIPGTVGAAPIQNIGAYGVELKDRFHQLEAFDLGSGELLRLAAHDCQFAYRDSVFKHEQREKLVITSVTFRLPKVWQSMLDYGDIRAELAQRQMSPRSAQDIADVVSAIRRSKLPDPVVIGNAGSFFKNPLVPAAVEVQIKAQHPSLVSYAQADGQYKLAAGWLIDQCGWKGRSLDGRAAVHDRQALVLVNRGGASGADILVLARAIQESVQQKFGVELEPEPVMV